MEIQNSQPQAVDATTGASEQSESQYNDCYLENLKTTKTKVYIFLISGIKLVGEIVNYDDTSIHLKNEVSSQLVFKQVISTIISVSNAYQADDRQDFDKKSKKKYK